ncbi:MAG: hypothetical protein ACRDQ5_20935, partial [Sciscionella sp.]
MATKGQSGEGGTYYSVPGEGGSDSGGAHTGGSADSAVEARPPDLADSGWNPSDGSNPDGRYYDTGTTEYVDDSGNYRITMYQHASDRAALRTQAETDRTRAAAEQNPWLSALGRPPQPDYYRNANNDQAEQLAKGLPTREPSSLPKSLYTNVDHPTMRRMVTE